MAGHVSLFPLLHQAAGKGLIGAVTLQLVV